MAWSYTIENETILHGNIKIVFGTWNADSVTGGDISTGLSRVDVCLLGHTGSATEAAVAATNETFPLASGDVTVIATSGDTGTFIAIGQ
tara:strand:- start:335 stop:601 length:267 start_codon:yes stop_codon:yes gene_type:complete